MATSQNFKIVKFLFREIDIFWIVKTQVTEYTVKTLIIKKNMKHNI